MPGFFRSLRSSAAALPRRARSRRGTVVLLALAFLAIVSIAALAYVTLVRVDRASSTALQRQQNYQQQVTAVVSDIQALLAADLAGNKIVTPSTPRTVLVNGFDVNVWPRFFEDGETWDYPYTNTRELTSPLQTGLGTNRPTYTFAPAPGTALTSSDWDRARLGFFEETRAAPLQSNRRYLAALPDDAWLASYDPNWDPGDPNNTRSWQQITNLRSAYRFIQDTNGDGIVNTVDRPSWQRGDGLFADLSRFFTNPTPDGFANPAANLLVPDAANPNGPNNLRAERGANQRLPDNVNYTGVMRFNMAQLGRELGDSGNDQNILDAVDEAQWADTDGDLRPDARWTQLDSLGELYGLKWVVAARIVDASALINVNSSVEFSYGPTPEDIATGATPADVDLFRLLNESNLSGAYAGTIRTDQLQARQFRSHIEQTLGVGQLISELSGDAGGIRSDQWVRSTYTPWQRGSNQLKPDQRDAFWRYIGAAPDRPAFSRAGSYPIRDIIDLFAFSGTNNRGLVSKVEETFDGPETGGYLPGSGVGILTGPLRAKEVQSRARSFAPAPPSGERTPTLEQLQDSVRRYITPISGVSLYSPVPTADGQTPMPKVGLRDFMPPPPGARREEIDAFIRRKPELMRRTVSGLVWALAPFVTDGPLPAPLDEALAASYTEREILAGYPNAGYGGGQGGLYRALKQPLAPTPVGASASVLTALSLAANLADAIDSNGSVPPVGLPPNDDGGDPTIIRFYNDPIVTDIPGTFDVIEMGTALTQGRIFQNALPTTYFGTPRIEAQSIEPTGVTVVGTEHHLFLTDVATIAIYDTPDAIVGPDDAICSVIMVRVSNPWTQRLSTQDYYLRLPLNRDTLDTQAITYRLVTDDVFQFVDPGDSMVFYAVPTGTLPVAGQTLRDTTSFLDALFTGESYGMSPVFKMDYVPSPHRPDPNNQAILFNDIDPTGRPPVLLCRRYGGGTHEIIVDRLSPPEDPGAPNGDVFGFPARIAGSGFQIDTPPTGYRNISGASQGIDIGYWGAMGYDVPPLPQDTRIADFTKRAGRVALWSKLSRPGTIPQGGGFPAYVMESDKGSLNLLDHHFDGALWLAPFDPVGDAPTLAPAVIADPMTLFLTPLGPITNATPFSDRAELHLEPTATARAANGRILDSQIAPFQVHVPNAPLGSLSDVALIPTAAFTYVNPLPRDDLAILAVRPPSALVSIPLANVTTAGEWRFRDLEYDHTPTDSVLGTPNPSVGTLDLTRPILRLAFDQPVDSGELVPNIPVGETALDSLSTPLALRVFEIFEPQAPVERLLAEGVTKTQGRININTAPRRVLEMVPYLAPALGLAGAGSSGTPLPADPNGFARIEALLDYRDQTPSTANPNRFATPEVMTGLSLASAGTGLRDTMMSTTMEFENDLPAGVVNIGELAVLGRWSQDPARRGQPEQTAISDYEKGFLYHGSGVGEMGKQPFSSFDNQVSADNDAEERLGLFHGVANSVSTRSDVFIAWFVIRGYDPKSIESIPIAGSPLNAMKDEAFRPAYESRWLGVFDRSNVRQPTDRPKILLLVELPKASG